MPVGKQNDEMCKQMGANTGGRGDEGESNSIIPYCFKLIKTEASGCNSVYLIVNSKIVNIEYFQSRVRGSQKRTGFALLVK